MGNYAGQRPQVFPVTLGLDLTYEDEIGCFGLPGSPQDRPPSSMDAAP